MICWGNSHPSKNKGPISGLCFWCSSTITFLQWMAEWVMEYHDQRLSVFLLKCCRKDWHLAQPDRVRIV